MSKIIIYKSWKSGNWSVHPSYVKFWTDATELKWLHWLGKRKKIKNAKRR